MNALKPNEQLNVRTSLLLWLFICCSNTNIKAQTIPKDSLNSIHKNVLTTYPLFDAFGAVNLGYEHAFSKRFSSYQWIVYYPFSDNPPMDIKSNTMIGMSQGRFYPFKKAPKGYFAGPFVYYAYTWYQSAYDYNETGTDYLYRSANTVQLAFGIVTGYKFIIRKRIAAELTIGAGRNFLWGEEIVGYNDKFMVFPMINLGYAFR